MFMSICAFSLMDIIVKWSVDYPIGQVLFFRGFLESFFIFLLFQGTDFIIFMRQKGLVYIF